MKTTFSDMTQHEKRFLLYSSSSYCTAYLWWRYPCLHCESCWGLPDQRICWAAGLRRRTREASSSECDHIRPRRVLVW